MVEKLERQMSLLAALLQTEQPLTAAELQRRVEGYPDDKTAFRRTFERDKDDLRRIGVPIELIRQPVDDTLIDGYLVRRDEYYLHGLGLEADETIALSMALRLIRLEGSDVDDAMWKLGGGGATEAPAEIGAIAMGPWVTQLHQAITARVCVAFAYRDEQRLVEPWRLEFRRGHWYVHAHDIARGDARSFRIDRIDGAIETLEQPATTPRGEARSERQPWEFGDDDDTVVRAHVAIDASLAPWARHQLGERAVVTDRPDGAIEVEFDVVNRHGFRTFVLGMLDGAEVLGPPELRRDVIEWLEALT